MNNTSRNDMKKKKKKNRQARSLPPQFPKGFTQFSIV